ncbi:MAG: xanthine dehydrogenase family protein molybdopterin-binding subunit [Acetobacteraceae bacterium]|nr:xanthine dehydrogenase family protein molybdopterin-binding subunit [Acetobacteraceae bacterium]
MQPFAGRREDRRLLTGAGRYTADHDRPDQLHAVFVRSDRAHARIAGLDIDAVRAAPGVALVLTGTDTRDAGMHRTPALLPFPGRDGAQLIVPPRRALADDRVRYVGEPVLLVLADTVQQAMDAAELAVIDYEDLPALASRAASLAPGAIAIHAEAPGNLCLDYEYGDEAAVRAAFAQAAHVVTLETTSDRVVGNPMEPKAALVEWDGDTVHLWAGNQGSVALRDSLAGLTGLPSANIVVHADDVGGGFGIRGPAYAEHVAMVLASQRAGRPVKWVASRSETFLSDYHGRGLTMTGSLALDAEGRFLALRHDWVCDLGAYPVATGPLISTLNPAMMCTGCYRIPAVYGQHRLALTNTVPITAYRGAGRPDMAYVIERLVDAAARQTGLDRIALRRLNALPPEAFPYTLPTGGKMAATYDSGDYPALLEAALTHADWDGFPARRAQSEASGHLRGIGCALFVEPAGGVVPKDEVALIIDRDGVEIHCATKSSGQGHETVFPEIVGRALGIAPERITLHAGEPDGPALLGGGAFASRSMLSQGAASQLAAATVIRKGRALASSVLEAAEADIEYGDGMFRVAGTDIVLDLFELAGLHPGGLDTVEGLTASRAYPSGAHVAEVEIDPATGTVGLLNYVAVDDCGVVLNHTLMEGQLLGGMVQGLGQVMGEVCVFEADSGQILTGSFMDYTMPRAELLPRFSLHELSQPSPNNALGVKGVGEAGTTGSLSAAMNAILDALAPAGVTHFDMPASPSRVWNALQAARGA